MVWPEGPGFGRRVVLRKLGLPGDTPQEALEAALRGFQRSRALPITGVPDRATQDALGMPADWGLPPTWYHEGLTREDIGLRAGLTEAGLRRLEGQHGIFPGCSSDHELAILVDQWT